MHEKIARLTETDDTAVAIGLIEDICDDVRREWHRQDIADSKDSFLLAAEWPMFQAVHNRGGRALCQDNKKTFTIMRLGQFAAWDEATLASYLDDPEAPLGPHADPEKEDRNLNQEVLANTAALQGLSSIAAL